MAKRKGGPCRIISAKSKVPKGKVLRRRMKGGAKLVCPPKSKRK